MTLWSQVRCLAPLFVLEKGDGINAFQKRSGDLASWSMAHLVNRSDRFGHYPAGPRTSFDAITHQRLVEHFQGDLIMGLHSVGLQYKSTWFALDFDNHGTNTEGDNLSAALEVAGQLESLGLDPLLINSDGRGGLHLITLLSEPLPADLVWAFVHKLWSDLPEALAVDAFPSGSRKPAAPPKTFEDGAKAPGGWLRLPGKHHSREHWSTAWHGSGWLDDQGTVDLILSKTGSDPAKLVSMAEPYLGRIRQQEAERQRIHKERAREREQRVSSGVPLTAWEHGEVAATEELCREALESAGFHQPGRLGEHYYTRPGKTDGVSAEVCHQRSWHIRIWSKSCSVPEGSYSLPRFVKDALFDGCWNDAERWLQVRGFGRNTSTVTVESVTTPEPGEALQKGREALAFELEKELKPGARVHIVAKTGLGKTYHLAKNCTEAALCGTKSVIALPTHLNIAEFVSEFLKPAFEARGHDHTFYVAWTSERTAENCNNFKQASNRLRKGLPPGCDRDCPHKASNFSAMGSDLLVTTHKSLELNWKNLTRGRDIIVIDENPIDVLRPKVTLSQWEILQAQETFQFAAMECDGCALIADWLDQLVAEMDDAMRGEYSSIGGIEPPRMSWGDVDIETLSMAINKTGGSDVSGKLMRALQSARITVYNLFKQDGHGYGWRLTGVDRNDVPPDAMLIASDATSTTEAVAEALGCDVVAVGDLPTIHSKEVVQVCKGLTYSAREDVAIGLIRSVAWRHLRGKRVGLIALGKNQEKWLKAGLAGICEVTRSTYFYRGDDVGCDTWPGSCDVLLVAGVPRPGIDALAERSVQLGAEFQNDDFDGGRHRWESDDGYTISYYTFFGETLRKSEKALTIAKLKQAVGRSRFNLPDGIPCLVVCDAPLGETVSRSLGAPVLLVSDLELRILRTIESMGQPAKKGSILNRLNESLAIEPVTNRRNGSGVVPCEIRNLPRSSATRILKEMVEGGLLVRESKGYCVPPPDCPR